MADLTEQIASGAAEPQTITVDGTTTVNRPLSDQVAADQHTRAAKATAPGNLIKTLKGICVRIVPPGGH